MQEITKLKNFINGKYVDPKGGKYLENMNPTTGKVHSLIPDSDKDDVDFAVECATKAFPIWSSMPTKDRANKLVKKKISVIKYLCSNFFTQINSINWLILLNKIWKDLLWLVKKTNIYRKEPTIQKKKN